MFNLIQKNMKKIVIALVIILTVLVPVCYYIYQENLKEIERVTWEYWNTGDERRGGLVISYAIKENNTRKFVFTKNDFLNPVTTVMLTYQKIRDKDDVQFETFYLERTGINSFRVKESIISSSTKYTFDEAVEIAKKYDVYKNNPDKDKIYNYPELNLTPEQIQQNKEKADEQKAFESQQQKAKEEFEKATPAEKIRLLEADIADLQKMLSETQLQTDKEYFPQIIEDYQNQINQIKTENGIN